MRKATSDIEKPADHLVDQAQVAERLDVATGTLAGWRCRGIGPPYIQVGARGRVRYRTEDVDAWLDAHTHGERLTGDQLAALVRDVERARRRMALRTLGTQRVGNRTGAPS
jgi:hypothetical protein